MNSRKLTLLGLWVVAVSGAPVSACQTYDFEPVEPLAIAQTTRTIPVAGRRLKPNLMLLVDKSGSMNDPIDCRKCGSSPECDYSGCPSRWSELQSAMNEFLTSYGSVGRMGLMFYPMPGGNGCSAPGLSNVVVELSASDDVDADLQSTAEQINKAIQDVTNPVGGTPTGKSLEVLSNYPPLLDTSEDREQFVVVLTDGLPNCNENNPNDWDPKNTPGACRCTQPEGCGGNLVRLGCLDQDNTVLQVQELKARGIRSIIIGFGGDTANGDGPEVLNAMAEAGGFARACPAGTDAECGGAAGSCNPNTRLCTQKFYQAATRTDLALALAQISEMIGSNPCEYLLEAQPTSPELLTVSIDGTSTPRGPDTWTYEAGKVTFQGALCSKLEAATTNDPIEVEFRVVEAL